MELEEPDGNGNVKLGTNVCKKVVRVCEYICAVRVYLSVTIAICNRKISRGVY